MDSLRTKVAERWDRLPPGYILPILKLLVVSVMISYTVFYQEPRGIRMPDHVAPITIAISVFLGVVALYLLTERGRLAPPLGFLVLEGVGIVAFVTLYSFDPRKVLFPLVIWVMVEATVVLSAAGSMLAWGILSAAYLGREIWADVHYDIEINTGSDAMRVITALAILIVIQSIISAAEARRVAEQERDTAQELREIDEAKTMFLRAVSHDLKTPLSVISGFSDLLQSRGETLTPDMRAEMVDSIASSAHRLHKMLNDLLDVDRLARGALKPHLEKTDVGALVREVVANTEVEDRPLEVHAADVEANVDAAKVERVVENLLINAVRHTERGTPVEIRVASANGGVEISVEDRGPGVPDAHKKRIFEVFARGVDPDQPAPGSGIGLSLVSGFAEMHGGRAWVEDRIGGGSCFKVHLPHAEEARA